MRALALVALLVVLLGACTTPGPIVPYPEVAYVTHPLRLGAEQALDDLLEHYSVSPNRNPDGLGVLETLWLNSRMTLVTWPTAAAAEERNRVAFARSEAEHSAVLRKARALYAEHWVFEGVLLGDFENLIRVAFYQPDGIYAVDDRGRKFYPGTVEDADPLVNPRVVSRFGAANYGYPRLVFPKDAITAQTRSLSLYFAALGKRLRFSWVFDPDYDLPAGATGIDSGREQNRLFAPQ